MTKTIIASIAMGLALAATTARAADAPATPAAKESYTKLCKGCHGAEGKGDTTLGEKMGAKDWSDPKIQDKMKDDEMFKGIKEGVKKADKVIMKPYADKLTDPEIKALVAHIRTFKKK